MENFSVWRDELIFLGNIAQDDDESISPDESEKRFNRYIEILDSLDGSEGFDFALAIFESIQAHYDYGAYQVALRTARRFGPEQFAKALLRELPRLIEDLPDWAGDILGEIANGPSSYISAFNLNLSKTPTAQKSMILEFTINQEESGWLQDKVGVLGDKA